MKHGKGKSRMNAVPITYKRMIFSIAMLLDGAHPQTKTAEVRYLCFVHPGGSSTSRRQAESMVLRRWPANVSNLVVHGPFQRFKGYLDGVEGYNGIIIQNTGVSKHSIYLHMYI